MIRYDILDLRMTYAKKIFPYLSHIQRLKNKILEKNCTTSLIFLKMNAIILCQKERILTRNNNNSNF